MRFMQVLGRRVVWPVASSVRSACGAWRESIRREAIRSLADCRIGYLEAALVDAREDLKHALERERQTRAQVEQIEQLKRLRPGPVERF